MHIIILRKGKQNKKILEVRNMRRFIENEIENAKALIELAENMRNEEGQEGYWRGVKTQNEMLLSRLEAQLKEEEYAN
jgi:hypothetical protein